jgi:hypothetical protein
VQIFWTFILSFDILATVLATFQNIGQDSAQFSGHSAEGTAEMLECHRSQFATKAYTIMNRNIF